MKQLCSCNFGTIIGWYDGFCGNVCLEGLTTLSFDLLYFIVPFGQITIP